MARCPFVDVLGRLPAMQCNTWRHVFQRSGPRSVQVRERQGIQTHEGLALQQSSTTLPDV
eukprot:4097801-Amphidinium_carterae.1